MIKQIINTKNIRFSTFLVWEANESLFFKIDFHLNIFPLKSLYFEPLRLIYEGILTLFSPRLAMNSQILNASYSNHYSEVILAHSSFFSYVRVNLFVLRHIYSLSYRTSVFFFEVLGLQVFP